MYVLGYRCETAEATWRLSTGLF